MKTFEHYKYRHARKPLDWTKTKGLEYIKDL